MGSYGTSWDSTGWGGGIPGTSLVPPPEYTLLFPVRYTGVIGSALSSPRCHAAQCTECSTLASAGEAGVSDSTLASAGKAGVCGSPSRSTECTVR